jgi:spermidine synthase
MKMSNKARPGPAPAGLPVFLFLLFTSGFASLVYEVVWTRTLLSVFGATVYASGTVLTSFMCGLGLGGYLAGRWGDRIVLSPLRVYALLELIIGLYALAFPWLLAGITALYVGAFGLLGGSFTLFAMVRFALAFLVLLLPATMMGATLPIVTRYGVAQLASLGRDLGKLYAVNTAGAALGTFLTGYLFIEWLGIRATTLLAVALNFSVFAGAWWLGRRRAPRAGAAPDAAVGEPLQKAVAKPSSRRKPAAREKCSAEPAGKSVRGDRSLILIILAISGCCALAYEVLWARILVYVLGNFVHSFSVMLAAFLTGIALGSYVLGRRADRLDNPWAWLGGCQAIIGLCAIVILPIFLQLIGWRESFLDALSFEGGMADYRDPWWELTAWKVGATFLLMCVPTFCMGASFPLANRIYVASLRQVCRSVGLLYAVNTFGSISGAFLASFVLIPWLGIRNSAFVFAALNLVGAVIVGARGPAGWRPGCAVLGAGALSVLLLAGLAVIPRDIFYPVYASAEKGKRLLYVDESVAGTVTIHETPGGFRVIDINGLNVAGTKFGFLCTQKLQAHFPLLMHRRPQNVLQIGFGTGGTCYSVSLHPEVARIDCVEINPGVIKAAPFFEASNQAVLADPRVHIAIEDARNFVMTTDTTYDVILSDSIHPRFTGNGLLYTADYFQVCARALNPDGILSTWLPTAFLGPAEYRMIIRTLQSVFPHVLIWYMNNTVEGYTIVMGCRQPFAVDWDALETRMERPALAADLEDVHMGNPFDLLDCVIMGDPNVAPYVGEGPLNTEDRPLIEFRAPRNLNRVITEYRNLEEILRNRNFPEAILGGWSEDPTVAGERRGTFLQFWRGTAYILQAHQSHLLQQYAQEDALYRQALAVNPRDRDVPFLARRLERLQGGERLDW